MSYSKGLPLVRQLCSSSFRRVSSGVSTRSVSDLLRVIKSKSSGWIHDNFRALEKFGWQEGYGAFSVSRSDCARVTKYIRNQAEHHRAKTFKDEFVQFLEAHEVDYDERFIWK